MTIGLTYDLRSDYLAEGFSEDAVLEFDSDNTVRLIEETIQSLGYRTERIGHARRLCARLVQGERWELVFNIAEGVRGRCREAQVPALLELYGIPYTFSDPLVCAATLDKAVAKRLVRDARVPTPAFCVVACAADIERVALAYPVFAKPIAEGTGKGISDHSRIESAARLAETCRALLARYEQPVLIEEFLPGREFTVGILGAGETARVIGTMEIHMRETMGGAIYSSATKERYEELVTYSRLAAGALKTQVEGVALAAYRALECRDAARVDIRCDAHGAPCFLEVNPLPGLHPKHSDLPMIATQEGLPYHELIRAIIAAALARRDRNPA